MRQVETLHTADDAANANEQKTDSCDGGRLEGGGSKNVL